MNSIKWSIPYFLLILILTSCGRDKYCDISLSKEDEILYSELSDLILNDISIVDSYKYFDYESNSQILILIQKLSRKPIALRKNKGVVTATLVKENTYYMETDFLSLTISNDTTQTSLKFNSEDGAYQLNCQHKVNSNMRIRSVTVIN